MAALILVIKEDFMGKEDVEELIKIYKELHKRKD